MLSSSTENKSPEKLRPYDDDSIAAEGFTIFDLHAWMEILKGGLFVLAVQFTLSSFLTLTLILAVSHSHSLFTRRGTLRWYFARGNTLCDAGTRFWVAVSWGGQAKGKAQPTSRLDRLRFSSLDLLYFNL